MALADYCLCDVCSCKTFYDAGLDYDNCKTVSGKPIPNGAGDMTVLCEDCTETHFIQIRQVEQTTKEGK